MRTCEIGCHEGYDLIHRSSTEEQSVRRTLISPLQERLRESCFLLALLVFGLEPTNKYPTNEQPTPV